MQLQILPFIITDFFCESNRKGEIGTEKSGLMAIFDFFDRML